MLFKSLKTAARERVFWGILGALLLSAICAFSMLLIWRYGKKFSAIGFFSAMGAAYGYEIFGKKMSLKGIVISIIISFVLVIAVWHVGLVWDICSVNEIRYSEGLVDFKLTFWQAAANPYENFGRYDIMFDIKYSLRLIYSLYLFVMTWIMIVILYNVQKKKIERVAQSQSKLNGEEIKIEEL